jgi:hypothetical protein
MTIISRKSQKYQIVRNILIFLLPTVTQISQHLLESLDST